MKKLYRVEVTNIAYVIADDEEGDAELAWGP